MYVGKKFWVGKFFGSKFFFGVVLVVVLVLLVTGAKQSQLLL